MALPSTALISLNDVTGGWLKFATLGGTLLARGSVISFTSSPLTNQHQTPTKINRWNLWINTRSQDMLINQIANLGTNTSQVQLRVTIEISGTMIHFAEKLEISQIGRSFYQPTVIKAHL